MRNKIQIVNQEINAVQNELDTIESKILTKLFGKTSIPDKTAVLFRLFGIDPNQYIHKFEEKIKPIMKSNGMIDAALLKKIIFLSKYKDIIQIINIPDADFYLSEYIESLIKILLPGEKK